jgi:hypothetical protein
MNELTPKTIFMGKTNRKVDFLYNVEPAIKSLLA